MKNLQNIFAEDIMTKKLITVNIDDSLVDVDQLLSTNEIHHLPVVNNEDELVGIISKYDLELLKDWGLKFNNNASKIRTDILFRSKLASDIMSKKITTVLPDTSLLICSEIILKNKFHSLPVVDHNKLVGIITSHDLIEFAYNTQPVTF